MSTLFVYLAVVVAILFPVWIGSIARLIFRNTDKQKLAARISLPFTLFTCANTLFRHDHKEFTESLDAIGPDIALIIFICLMIGASFLWFALYRLMARGGIALVDKIRDKFSNQEVKPTRTTPVDEVEV